MNSRAGRCRLRTDYSDPRSKEPSHSHEPPLPETNHAFQTMQASASVKQDKLDELAAHAATTDRNGKTPLHFACACGNTGLVCTLMKFMPVPNRADHAGQTPLHEAARNGWVECVSALLKAGSDANQADVRGLTPLHEASGNGRASSAW